MLRRNFLISAAALAAFPVRAQQGTARIIVGATPSGGTDAVARALAVELSKRLGKQFIIENKPGAGGNIGANAVAKAAPDGNTLLMCYASHAINASLYPTLPFDPVKDFTPLSHVASSPAILVGNRNLRANNIRELIAQAKAEPGRLNIALPGLGSMGHLAAQVLKMDTGIEIALIPYKGTGPAVTDVLAGHIDLVFAGISIVQSHIRSGALKAIGISSRTRLQSLPNIPAIAEVIPGYEFSPWYGLLGPANMNSELTRRISDATREAVASNEMNQHFLSQGMVPVGSSHEEFGRFLVAQIERLGKVVKASGAQPA
jgi:tripartite-type tricarboxylate transporter receptor subunit TctC